jgi:class 3 adenylate cyclase/tetratricopeptide (TPR) repeat protein
MKCPRCQYENPPASNFCLGCGTRLGATCGACGNELPAGSRFCNKCGAPVSNESAGEARFASPGSYTPQHLAERILTSKAALEGERKQVTVLFADLKGSMELLADRDPEEARKILDPVLEIMMEAVHRYEGTVNQVMGDGIMALFGAPLSHEDHAVRACYAALKMQEAIQRYSGDLRRACGVEVQIRVGLNSGEVVVRAIGSDLRMDYTAVGQTTHLAARMEQLAPPGSIRLTAETLRLVEGFVQVTSLGEVPVKGVTQPVEAFELVGAGAARRRFEAATARGLTRFVGRQQELQVLGQALERARTGHGQVVAPVGEPGVGKSRLFWEFTHSHRTQGWLILESGSASYGKATAYLPIIELLKGYFRVADRDEHREIREKVIGKLLALDRTLEPTLPAFLALLEVPFDDLAWAALDAPQRRQLTLDAIKRLLLRESRVRPLLLVFEDLHWIDSETQAVLDILVESLPTTQILLLVNYRPEYQHTWGGKSYYTQLRIDPLPPEGAEELLDGLLGDDATLRPLKKLLIERTEGNPFFLEESVRTLVETHVLAGERGAYRLAAPIQTVQVPATVQAVLAARIDRLPPQEKRLLQAAAVVGDDVPFALLHAIAEQPEEVLRQGLAHLQGAEFLYETHLFPDPGYTFKHGLTSQVAYGSLLQERRRTLHAKVVEAIEKVYAERITEHVERLALHALRGEAWEKAVTYGRQAGTKAMARSANREAAAYFEQSLLALRQFPETRETVEQAIDLRFNLQASLFPLGELERMLAVLREAEDLAKALDDPRRLAWAFVYGNFVHSQTGHLVEGRALGDKALAIGETLDDRGLLVVARYYRAQAHLGSNYAAAADLYRKNVQALEGESSRERYGLYGFPAVMSRGWLAWALAERGEFEEGLVVGEEGVQIAESLDHPFTMGAVYWHLSILHRIRGELGPAARLLDRMLTLTRDWNIRLLSSLGAWSLGYVHAISGRPDEGLELLREAYAAMQSMRYLLFRPLVLVHLGEASLRAGRAEDALATAAEGLAAARERKERGYEAYALRLLAEIASSGEPSEAEKAQEQYRQAIALAEEMGMRPLIAHCRSGLARLYRRMGKRAESDKHLAVAASMYCEMGMPFWLEKAKLQVDQLA